MKRTSIVMFVTVVMLAALTLAAATGPATSAAVAVDGPLTSSPAAMPDSPSATLFSYQGQVSDAAGVSITNPALPMTFRLYAVAAGGTPCWTEAHTGSNAVAVTNGLFNVLLGQLTAIPSACLTGNAYLELVVNGETLSPRELLTSVAFAVEANTLTAGATTRGDLNIGGALTVPGYTTLNGDVGIGVTKPGIKLAVTGQSAFSRDGTDGFGQNFTVAIAEHTQQTGKKAQLGFHNGGAAEGHIRLDDGAAGRTFVFGSEQTDMDGLFTGDLRADQSIYASGNVSVGGSISTIGSVTSNNIVLRTDSSPSGIEWSSGSAALGRAVYDTNYSTDARAGDLVLRASDGKRLILGRGSGVPDHPAAVVIDPSGKVGIGTTNPGVALHVASPSATSLIESTSPGNGVALTFRTDAADRWRNVVNGSGLNYRYDWESSGASGPVMSLTADGRVGIGTSSPDAKLTVSGGLNLGSQTWADNQIKMYYDRDEFPGIYGFIIHRGEAGGQGGLTIGAQTDSEANSASGDIRFLTSSNGSPATPKLVIRGNGSISCGALVEANLQTEAETAFGYVQRFDEGAVLCWGLDQLELCAIANDRLVQAVADSEGRPIVIGAEKVKVLGPIRRGDILVASDMPGYAMVNGDPRSGSVIAQALEDFDGKRGIIKAMIRKW